MPTRTPEPNPFAPQGAPTREELLAYAQGRLDAGRRQWIESHLEADPLLADALDGLMMEGAAMASLDPLRPRTGVWKPWAFGGACIVLVGAAILLGRSADDGAVRPDQLGSGAQVEAHAMASSADSAFGMEIDAAEEQPESLRIGHEPEALHTRAAAVPRITRDSLDQLAARNPAMRPAIDHPEPLTRRRSGASWQLIFLHDLKLVHPKELHANDAFVRSADAGVLARFVDAQEQQRANGEEVLLPYTAYMDEAIGRFAAGDHKGALDDLRFVLRQYPDDVNALFYAGLCAYNLGLLERARGLLQRAASHRVDVFDEEAAWYHALTLERLGEQAAAQEAFARIAGAGGFYAAAARARMVQGKP